MKNKMLILKVTV